MPEQKEKPTEFVFVADKEGNLRLKEPKLEPKKALPWGAIAVSLVVFAMIVLAGLPARNTTPLEPLPMVPQRNLPEQ